MTAVLVLLTILAAISIDAGLVAWRQRRHGVAPLERARAIEQSTLPAGIFLSPGHTWLALQSDGRFRIGLDQLLTQAVGKLDGFFVPAGRRSVRRGEPLLTLKLGGKSLTIPSPVDGELVSANSAALESPALVTEEPYSHGWLVTMRPTDTASALQPLRIGAAAVRLLREELQRLADFATPVQAGAAVPVLADGGLPAQGFLASAAPDELARFEREFLFSNEVR